MHELTVAVIMGIVQGITEFLPISSSGHLIITSALIGDGDPRLKTFEVVIQFGSILAVLLLYRKRFIGLLLPGKFGEPRPFSGIRGLFLLFLTCLPASLVGLFCYDFIKERLFNPSSVALALVAGGIAMLLVERRNHKETVTSVDGITPMMALGIGMCQCFSLWPGFSRSASTIMGGMLLGAKRGVAAEYSFIAAVPIMLAATGFDLVQSASFLESDDLPFFIVGMGVSFIVALLAIKVFVGLLGRISLAPFAWYRLALAPLVYWALCNVTAT
ncbi:MAG: Undecaprenyl-diphosphatase [Desulfovibrio sp.]